MEYIRIGDRGAIVSLTAAETAEYRAGWRDAVRRIMRKAEINLGRRVYVEMYEMKNGGCELFMTGLDERRGTMSLLGGVGERMLAEYGRRPREEGCVIYAFDKLETMLLCCKMLDGSGYIGVSESFADRERGKYYLVLERRSEYPSEAMGSECLRSTIAYIREHCTQFFGEDAVPVLSSLA